MKTKIAILFFALIFSANTFSQFKIFSGGSVTIGATTSPTANAVTHQIIGGTIVFPASTSAITSAPLIKGYNGYSSASAPDFSWLGDPNTGMYHPSNDILGFVSNGTEVMRINTNRQILNSNTSHSKSSPDFSFNDNNTTGMFLVSNGNLGFSTATDERFRINSSGQLLSVTGPSNAATPDFSWSGDSNTGIFTAGADALGFSTGGKERMRLNSVGTLVISTTTNNFACTYSVTLNSDWASPTSITYVNKANSGNYEVNLSGTTKFYVAGQGWIYSDGNYLGSDVNIKDEIKSIDSAMSKISKINGVLYKLKIEKQNPNVYGTASEYMGVIAQDVEKVAPQVVKTLPDGTKAVCYEMLAGLFVEAFKEQNAKIIQLQNDINNCCTKAPQQNDRIINNPASPINSNEEYKGNSYIKQNTPNPFNKETSIEYFIAEKNADASVLVFDMNGKLLKTFKLQNSGKNSLLINGSELQPGMYYYSLIINNNEVGPKKMIFTE